MSPFSSVEAEKIASLGESDLIQHLKSALGKSNPPSPQGIGDDCAVFDPPPNGEKQLITTDPVIYGQHFDDSLLPEQTAAKLLKRNLSDIAAMGGSPSVAVIALALPKNVSTDWITRFYRSLAKVAQTYKTQIVGGDISTSSADLSAHLTLVGSVPENQILKRGSTLAESPLLVTGPLGGSILGHHHSFVPRLAEGRWLAQQPETVSCMDISDGLGKDCPQLLEELQFAHLDAPSIPISPEAIQLSKTTDHTPLYHAINDGEDFELLFALSPEANLQEFQTRWARSFDYPLHLIGKAEAKSNSDDTDIKISNTIENIAIHGYQHLR